MPHTPEQRSSRPLCGAKKRNGEPCRAFAGQGTDHKGIGRCKNHGGKTPSHNRAAAVTEAKRDMVKLGVPIPGLAPHEALLSLLRATAGHTAWLHRAVAELDDLATPESRMIVELYDSERDRLTRIAKACSDVGVNEREIRLHEQEAGIFAVAVDKAALALGMTAAQIRRLHERIAQELADAGTAAEGHEDLRKPGAIYGAA